MHRSTTLTPSGGRQVGTPPLTLQPVKAFCSVLRMLNGSRSCHISARHNVRSECSVCEAERCSAAVRHRVCLSAAAAAAASHADGSAVVSLEQTGLGPL